jgi:hypothetical protein
MKNTSTPALVVRSVNAAAKRKFKEAAKHIPIEIAEELEARRVFNSLPNATMEAPNA